jgi:hypothetical protein
MIGIVTSGAIRPALFGAVLIERRVRKTAHALV